MERIISNDQILLKVSQSEEELIKKALMFLVRQTDNDEAKAFLDDLLGENKQKNKNQLNLF